MVHQANEQGRTAVRPFLKRLPVTSRWQRVVVDAGYASPAVAAYCRRLFAVEYEVVRRQAKGFQLLPKRWVVERTFAWLGKYRRLSKDYAFLLPVSEAFLYIAWGTNVGLGRMGQTIEFRRTKDVVRTAPP